MATKKKAKNQALLPREIKLVQLVCKEKSNKQIAEAMGKSPAWVDWVKASVYKKINRSSPVGMAMYAVKNGIVKAL